MNNQRDIISVAKWRMTKAEDQLQKAILFLDSREYSEVLVKSYYLEEHLKDL